MRHASMLRRLASLAWLAPLVFLALPNCVFHPPTSTPPNLQPGDPPLGSAVFCDIEQPLGRRCATSQDLATGIRLSHRAVALALGETSNVALDFSPAARATCSGAPQAIVFRCQFPQGCPICLKCIQAIGPSPAPYGDASAACAARCEDFFGPVDSTGAVTPENPPDPAVRQFCESASHVSTNAPVDDCQGGACTPAGMLRPDYDDPRRNPEPVIWRDLVDATTGGLFGNNLTRTTVGTGNFDAGAASVQAITAGDGFVEFTAGDATSARAAGLSVGNTGTDTDATLDGIGFAVRLTPQAELFIHESGVQLAGPLASGAFATYAAGDRVRVGVTDNDDGTAVVGYSLIPASCAGPGCTGTLLRSTGAVPYPFRVDASIRTQGATLNDVRVMRIK